MRIDANSDGTISWDEFTSYLLLGTDIQAIISRDMVRRTPHTSPPPRSCGVFLSSSPSTRPTASPPTATASPPSSSSATSS